jgi:hypothetical protein
MSLALLAWAAFPLVLAQAATPVPLQTWPPNQHPWWNLPDAQQPKYSPPSPQDMADQKKVEAVVDKYAHLYIKVVPGIWGMDAGWSNDGRPEIDLWASAITAEIKRRVPSSLDGIPVVVYGGGESPRFIEPVMR